MLGVKTGAAVWAIHRYDSGRKSYDSILHALHDWEQAQLIIIVRDFDVEAKQYKAMRIWISYR